jgi:hypothetical protein
LTFTLRNISIEEKWVVSMTTDIIIYLGLALIGLGALADLIASIGMHRFKNFYLRLHATTVGTIWGAVFPIIHNSLRLRTIRPIQVLNGRGWPYYSLDNNVAGSRRLPRNSARSSQGGHR